MTDDEIASVIATVRERDAAVARAEAAERLVADMHGAMASAHRRAENAEAERDAARVLCDGCADAEIRTGSAHYTDCPVNALIVERDAARREAVKMREVVSDLLTKIDKLRRLPVISVCGECRYCHVSGVCMHQSAHAEHEIDGVACEPPDWCPLRGVR